MSDRVEVGGGGMRPQVKPWRDCYEACRGGFPLYVIQVITDSPRTIIP